jgi:hypothetical protein
MLGAVFLNQRFELGFRGAIYKDDVDDNDDDASASAGPPDGGVASAASQRAEAKQKKKDKNKTRAKEARHNILQDAKNSTLLTFVNVLGVFVAAIPWFYFEMHEEYDCLYTLKTKGTHPLQAQ